MIWIVSICLWSVVICGRLQDLDTDRITCETMFCANGQECTEQNGIPECTCVERCIGKAEPVCGTNGTHMKTYSSKCELYRQACLMKDTQSITMVSDMSCEEGKMKEKKMTEDIEKDEKKQKPIVCMQKDRDALRDSIMKFIGKELDMDHKDISYKGLLLKYFFTLDINDDGALDTEEIMAIVDDDMLSTEELRSSNVLFRGLCMGELIAITDYNSDYKLEFDEFHECLNPSFKPPVEKCESYGMKYDEGDDIPIDCNTCKCACGHWVCTHITCKKSDNTVRGQWKV